MTIVGQTLLNGQFTTNSLDVENALTLGIGGTLATAGATIGSSLTLNGGSLTVKGDVDNSGAFFAPVQLTTGGLLSVGGTLTASFQQFSIDDSTLNIGTLASDGDVSASDGSTVRIGTIVGVSPFIDLYADTTSSVEIGSAGGAALGAITVDSGITLTEAGDLSAPLITDNGTIIATDGGLLSMFGTLGGTGQVDIGNNATLNIDAVASNAPTTLAFTGNGGLLALGSDALDSSKILDTKIVGFNNTDAIDYQGTVTQASYSNNVLTLLDGTAVVAKLKLNGNYTGQSFTTTALASNISYGGEVFGAVTQINLITSGDTTTAPAGTASQDSYSWNSAAAGSWDAVSNWFDTTTNAPATVAPGSHDDVTIGNSVSKVVETVSGTGASKSLTIGGPVSLSGQFTTSSLDTSGALQIGASGSLTTDGTATLSAPLNVKGGSMIVNGDLVLNVGGAQSSVAEQAGGHVSVTGTMFSESENISADASTFSVGVLQGDGNFSATDGAKITIGTVTDALSSTLTADATSSIEIGTGGQAAAGSITIDSGVTLAEGGFVSAPVITNNGTMVVTAYGGNFLSLNGQLGGGGEIDIGANGTLRVDKVASTSTNTIDFTGSAGLLTLGADALDTSKTVDATISDFDDTDAIDYQGVVTQASYSNGTLTLLNGTTAVAHLKLSGDYTGQSFAATQVPTISYGGHLSNALTQISLSGLGDTATAPDGTASQDSYQWIGPVAGSWDQTANWFDDSTGSPALVAPGINDDVTIGTNGSGVVTVISGKGTSASVTTDGPTAFTGQITTGGLDAEDRLAIESGGSLTTNGTATIAAPLAILGGIMAVNGDLADDVFGAQTSVTVDAGGSLSVTGTLTGTFNNFSVYGGTFDVGTFASNGNLSATHGAQVQIGTIDGPTPSIILAADATSSIEIGSAGHAAAGSITVDDGVTLTDFGSISAPLITDNGTIAVADQGTLAFSGKLTGHGEVDIQDNAALSIDAIASGSTNTIDFKGNGGRFAFGSGALDSTKTLLPTIGGLSNSDAIDYKGTATRATYSGGTLSLFNGSTLVANMALTGDFSAKHFVVTALPPGSVYGGQFTGAVTQITTADGPPVNPPTISGTKAGQTTTSEASIKPFASVTIADPNTSATETLTIALTSTNGTSAYGGGTFSPATGLTKVTDGVYTLTGTPSSVTTALKALSFTASPGPANTPVTTTFTLTDSNGGTGVSDATTTVTDTRVVALPTIVGTKAGQTTTSEAAIKPFAGVTVADSNTGATETVTILLSQAANFSSYGGGTLSGAGLTQLSTGIYKLSGTPTSVTSALKALSFTPIAGPPNTPVTTYFELLDDSSAGTGTANSTTAVTDTRVVALPTITGTKAGQTSISEAAVKPFSGVTIADTNAGATETLTITLSKAGNALAYGGGTLSGAGLTQVSTGVYTLSGTAASVTTALKALSFTPTAGAANTPVTTVLSLRDTSTAGSAATNATTTVVDTHVVVPPSITGTKAGQTSTSEAVVKPFSGVTIADTNAGATETLTITLSKAGNALSYGGGTLSGTGLTQVSNGIYSLSGTAASVTTALKALSFTPAAGAANTAVTTVLTLRDASSAGLSATNATTTVVDTHVVVPPTITGTKAAQATTSEAALKPFSGVAIADANAGASDTLTITLSNSNGALAYGGGTLSGSGGLTRVSGNVYSLSGTPASVTTALKALTFTPAAGLPNSKSTTTFTLSDSSTAGSSVSNATTTVVDTDPAATPTITGAVAGLTSRFEAPLRPFSAVTITDRNGGATETLTVTVTGTGGTLTGTGLSGGTKGVYTLTGTAAAVSTALDNLLFTPTAGTPNSASTTSFALSDKSSAGTTVVNSTTTVVDTAAAVAPTITGTKANQASASEAALKPFSGVTIADANSGAADTLTITLSGGGGTLTGTGLSGGTNGIYTLTGSPTTVTTNLKALSFKASAGAANVPITTTFSLSDSTGASTSASNNTTTVIDTRVVPLPTITGAKAAQATTAEAPVKPFSGITIADTNKNATDTLTIQLTSGGGTLTGTGLTLNGGTYTLSTASGTPATLTTALKALTFTPTAGAPGIKSTTTFLVTDTSSAGSVATNNITTVVDTAAAKAARPLSLSANTKAGSMFVFAAEQGQQLITDFTLGGARHDTLDLGASSFTSLAEVLKHTSLWDGSATIHLDAKDAFVLQDVTKAQLKAHPGDFVFHA